MWKTENARSVRSGRGLFCRWFHGGLWRGIDEGKSSTADVDDHGWLGDTLSSKDSAGVAGERSVEKTKNGDGKCPYHYDTSNAKETAHEGCATGASHPILAGADALGTKPSSGAGLDMDSLRNENRQVVVLGGIIAGTESVKGDSEPFTDAVGQGNALNDDLAEARLLTETNKTIASVGVDSTDIVNVVGTIDGWSSTELSEIINFGIADEVGFGMEEVVPGGEVIFAIKRNNYKKVKNHDLPDED